MTPISYNRKAHESIRSMAFISLCTALMCLSSYFVIPLPMTAAVLSFQSLFINLTALCLKKRDAVLSVLLYVFMGAVGLPVFSGGTSGISRLLSPVGGYYFGFILAVFLMSHFRGKHLNLRRYLAVTVLIGIPAEHITAVLFMSAVTSSSLTSSFVSISLPFIIGDLLKAVASCFVALQINKSLIKK